MYRTLLSALGVLVGLCFGAMALLIPLDMLLRGTGLGSMPWLSEVVEYAVFTGVFLAAPWVLAENGHVRVDLLVSALSPARARLLELALAILGFSICLSFVCIALLGAHDAYQFGAMIRRSLVIPEWWLLAVFVTSMVLLCIEFVIRIVLLCSHSGASYIAESDQLAQRTDGI